jgi:hypothetical protein
VLRPAARGSDGQSAGRQVRRDDRIDVVQQDLKQHREAELSRWHGQDHAANSQNIDVDDLDDADVLHHEPAEFGGQ